MTGKEFEKLMRDNGYTQTSLAERWGLVRQTIRNCCKAEKVDPLYADAIKVLAFEKQAAEFLKVVQFFK